MEIGPSADRLIIGSVILTAAAIIAFFVPAAVALRER